MKKKFIFLWPWIFKKSDWYKYEIEKIRLHKNFSTEIHQMVDIVSPKNQIKNNIKKDKIIKNYNDLITWKNNLEQKAKLHKVYILNDIRPFNYKSYQIRKILKSLQKNKKVALLEYYGTECPTPEKQSFKFLKEIVFQLIFNPFLIFSSLKIKFFNFLDKKQSYEPDYLLLVNNQRPKKKNFSKKIMFNSLDYSNYLLSNNKRLIKKKYAIYLDCPLPGSSDNNFFNLNFPFNTKKWFKSLNVFFLRIEKLFNLKIVIAPHPKNNINRLKKIYGKRRILNQPISLFSKHADFFISRNSTALSFPVIFKKPIFLIFSEDQNKIINYLDKLRYKAFSKALKINPINIDNEYPDEILTKYLAINNTYYKKYQKKFLTDRKIKVPNSEILKDLI